MALDFRADQLQVEKIIGVGTNGQIVVYPQSTSTDSYGGIPTSLSASLANSEVFFFVSGNIGSKGSGFGVSVFGGDVVVSGNLYVQGTLSASAGGGGGGSSNLQDAYALGNTIAVTTANGSLAISNTADTTDAVTISRTFAGLGDALSITMGSTATGDAIALTKAESGYNRITTLNSNELAIQVDAAAGSETFTFLGADGFASSNNGGMNWEMYAGDGDGSGDGGYIYHKGGNGSTGGGGGVFLEGGGGGTNNIGGIISLVAGNGNGTGDGGNCLLRGGFAGNSGGTGGNVTVRAGSVNDITGTCGQVFINGADNGFGGTAGNVNILAGSSSAGLHGEINIGTDTTTEADINIGHKSGSIPNTTVYGRLRTENVEVTNTIHSQDALTFNSSSNIGELKVFTVDGNPDTYLSAPQGSLAVSDEPALYQNQNGGTTWTSVGGSSGGGAPQIFGSSRVSEIDDLLLGVEVKLGGFSFQGDVFTGANFFLQSVGTLLAASGSSPTYTVRLYDMGIPGTPAAGTLIGSASLTVTSSLQRISQSLTLVAGVPSEAQISQSERLYEVRGLLSGSLGDSVEIDWAGIIGWS